MLPYSKIAELLSDKDPVMKRVIESVPVDLKPTPSIDIYLDLLNSIASQQLSVKVVRVIWQRFLDLFADGYPHAKQVVAMGHQTLRAVGLSNAKVNYIKNVAQFSLENPMDFEYLNELSDKEIIEYLTQIKGVGKWTVQMILMFPMDRPNVFPVDDLGIQTHMKKWYNIDLEKKELRRKLIELSEQWDPYKTLASKYLWRSGD
ncbi:MAG: DNA-3-methyladenine glycosylase [Prolixibacteraceae bacterium]